MNDQSINKIFCCYTSSQPLAGSAVITQSMSAVDLTRRSSLNYCVQVNFTSLGETTGEIRVVIFLFHFSKQSLSVRSWNYTTEPFLKK